MFRVEFNCSLLRSNRQEIYLVTTSGFVAEPDLELTVI
jgi:hypothetical protein